MKMNMNMNIIEYKINQHLNYNEHKVIYYQKSGDEETMALLESTVFHQLKEYREQANHERFILPKTEEIEFLKIKYTKSIF